MAGVTYTYTINMAQTPKQVHVGEQVLAFDWLSGASKFGTLSDMLLLGKLPNGALINSAEMKITTLAEAAHFALVLLAVESAGTFSVYATLRGSITASATAATDVNIFRPTKVSLSDDRAVQYVILALNCTTGASGTVSFSTYGNLRYVTDGSAVL